MQNDVLDDFYDSSAAANMAEAYSRAAVIRRATAPNPTAPCPRCGAQYRKLMHIRKTLEDLLYLIDHDSV
jgi:hypothetical protein